MITAIEATKYFYEILNVSSLTSVLTGSIYRINKPKNSELEDVVINTIFLDSDYEKDVQNGQANINIYCKKLDGQINIARINTLSTLVINLLKSKVQQIFHYEILQTNIFEESLQNSMNYLNIKLQIHKY